VASRLGVSLFATFALLAAGCGGDKVVNTDNAETSIERSLERQLGAEVRSVECPDEVKAEKGKIFVCTATGGDGTKAAIDVEQTSDEGDIRFREPLLHTGPAEVAIRDGIEQQTGDDVTVKCPDLVVARAGTELVCRATSGGVTANVDVTVKDTEGNIEWKLRKTK
jgi:hypothetical protein